MSTEYIYKVTVEFIEKNIPSSESLDFLDIGSGSGELIRRLKETRPGITSFACDYTDTLMEVSNQKVDIVDLNVNRLPYQENSFDMVTATEVIEHLENPRSFIRDIFRILKPGGLCILSTPNILNLNSRLRNLWFGFPRLFGPLPVADRNAESCFGHISPFSYFYLLHAFRESKYKDIGVEIDKYQIYGALKLIAYYLPIKLNETMIMKKEMFKFKTVDDSNIDIVKQLNSLKILLGRTIIVTAKK